MVRRHSMQHMLNVAAWRFARWFNDVGWAWMLGMLFFALLIYVRYLRLLSER